MDKISALMDGELSELEAHQALLRLDDTPEARERWSAYHLIGDVMRGETAPAFDVLAGVSEALSREATVLAPQRRQKRSSLLTYALSAAASISAVAAVGWMVFSTSVVVNPTSELVSAAPVAPVVETQLVSSPSDGQMNEYMLAHQGVSPSTSLHGVAPYIRTISVAASTGR